MPLFAEAAPVEPATPEFVSPTELPKSVTDPGAAEPVPSATDIVPPAEALAPQVSPPPGS
jgi:hypothetical protein